MFVWLTKEERKRVRKSGLWFPRFFLFYKEGELNYHIEHAQSQHTEHEREEEIRARAIMRLMWEKKRKGWKGFWGLVSILIALTLSSVHTYGQSPLGPGNPLGGSQINTIEFQNSSGTTLKKFASPFIFKCSTGLTCSILGKTVTATAAGGGGGGGYSLIQNGGAAIAAEGAINFLGSFSCVDNPGNASSDCKLSASAAVSHQFVTGIDSSGNYLRAQPVYSDISGTPTLAVTIANASHKWLNSYDSSTGLFTQTQPAYSDISGTPQLAITKSCTGTDKVSAYDSTTGLFTCTTDQTGAGGSTPTGTGFTHIVSGVQDAAAKTVDVSSSDITGVLAAASEPAHTGDVTNSAGSLTTVVGKVNGVTYAASPATDTVPVITAANTETYKTLPLCADTGGQHLNYDTSTHTFSCGTGILLGCSTIGVAGNAIGPITIPVNKLLHIETYISGYTGGGDTACLRFNNTAGTGYRNRWLVSTAGSTTFSAGANVNVSASCIKMGSDNVTTSRNVSLWVVNDSANTEKLVNFSPGGSGTGSAATQASITLGNGAWVSGASTSITQVGIVTLTTNMNAGSGFCVYGSTF